MNRLDWPGLRRGAIVMAFVVVALWVIELVDLALGHALDNLAIWSWSPVGLLGIITAPLLHFGIAHVAANSVPLFVLGTVLWAGGRREFAVVTIVGWLASGLLAWLLTPPGVRIAGASGVIMAWAAYLVVRGLLTRTGGYLAISVATLLAYGSLLVSVLPLHAGVSWQCHLGGALGGIVAAWLTWGKHRSRG